MASSPLPSEHAMTLRSGSGGRRYVSTSRQSAAVASTSSHITEHSSPQTQVSRQQYYKKTQYIETSGEGDANLQTSHLLSHSQLGSSPLLQQSSTTSSVVQRRAFTSGLDSGNLRSGYSSGYDSSEEREKTDYTYGRSFTYRSQASPNRECPSPNMSRTELYRSRSSSYKATNDDDNEAILHDLTSRLSASRSFRTNQSTQELHHSQSSSLSGSGVDQYVSKNIADFSTRRQETFLKRWWRYITLQPSWEYPSRSRSNSCSPWFLLLLLAALGSGLFWATTSGNLVNTTTTYLHKFIITAPPDINGTTREEIQAIVQHILHQQLAQRDDRLDKLDFNLATLQSISHGLASTLDTSQASYSDSQEQTAKQLRHLKEQVEYLLARVAELKLCCSNNTAVLTSLEERVGKLLMDVMDNPDHPFGQWLHQQFVLRRPAEPDRRMEDHESSATTANVTELRSLVWHTVHQALAQYDADKTGQADYALESAGGSVVSTRCSEAYQDRSAQFSVFGIPLWHFSHSPRKVIQPGVSPGECWPFRGSQGYLVIQLSAPVTPTAFTLEHIPASLSPVGHIDSAPRHFTVLGLTSEKEREGVVLGHYTYDITKDPLQTFSVQVDNPGVFPFIELRIESNHGNLEYTCLYRFRVHGIRSNL